MGEPAKNNFLTGVNSEYIFHLYAQYLNEKSSVDDSWQEFFDNLSDDEISLLNELNGASWTPEDNKRAKRGFSSFAVETGYVANGDVETSDISANDVVASGKIKQAASNSIRALMLIRAYRARGTLIANLDPLNLKEKEYHPELDPKHFGFTDSDYETPIYIGGVLGMEVATLKDIVEALKEIYCGNIGVQFNHLHDPEERTWLQKRIEAPRNQTDFTVNGKRAILQRLTAAEEFEKFLHKKWTGTKRFGLDGGEALIPAIEQIMKRGGQLGLKEIVLGMAHRGRLNVLTNVMGKPFSAVFSEFQGMPSNPDNVLGSGDVKYHLGTSSDRNFDGNVIHLSLTANPSHLEAVNPVVIGKVRAKQVLRKDKEATEVMPMLLHGDAAFAGQGIVAETLMISELPGYRVGGCVHIVINNQIGFTTMPKYGRSGPYCTDVAKMLSAPIFHVNGDDPESVVHVARIATEFRQKFKKDVVIDMFCYRRYGHNEGDEPAFTQPLMYKKIKGHPSTREIYAKKLITEKVITEEESKEIIKEFNDYLEKAFEASKSYKPSKADFLEGAWEGLTVAHGENRRGKTAISKSDMKKIGEVLTTIPEGFNANRKLVRILQNKKEMFDKGEKFDWSTAEALAFGSLINDDFAVRLSGQDVGRGTFSQRHAIMYDQVTEEKYIPLQNIKDNQPMVEIHDAPLSEAAVLGFEYGYSMANPNNLVLWEAQFGDFANCAQVVIDQFISSGETKWLRMSGLVLLLPHGYEGQGPEHSSARLERFLQLCGDDNWQVCNLTTPANYFHALRRQMCRDFRKPLVIMTPKSLLRHKLCVSKMEDFVNGSHFRRVLPDDDENMLVSTGKVKKVIICAGKVYYDLLEERRKREIDNIAIIRLEQLYPFPVNSLIEELAKYSSALEIIWCQEEPENQGGWNFVDRKLEAVLISMNHKCKRPSYVGREASAATATGVAKRHILQQMRLIDEALNVNE